MSSQDKYERYPDWKLERFLLGELDPDEMEMIRREIEKDPDLENRLEAFRQSDKEILERYPAQMMEQRIRAKVRKSGPSGADYRVAFGSKVSNYV